MPFTLFLITVEETNYIAGDKAMMSFVIKDMSATMYYTKDYSSNQTAYALKGVFVQSVPYRRDCTLQTRSDQVPLRRGSNE